MTHLPFFVLLGLVGEDSDFLGLAVLDDFGIDLGALDIGRTDFDAVVSANCEDLVKYDFVVCFDVELLDVELLAGFDLVLFSAGFNDCLHCVIILCYRLATTGGSCTFEGDIQTFTRNMRLMNYN